MGCCLVGILLLSICIAAQGYTSEFLNGLLSDLNLELSPHLINVSTSQFGHLSCSLLSRCTDLRVGDFYIDSERHVGKHSGAVMSTFDAGDLSLDCSGKVLCNSCSASVVHEFGLEVQIPWLAVHAQVFTFMRKRSMIPTHMHLRRCNLRARLNKRSFRLVTNHETLPLEVIEAVIAEFAPVFAPEVLKASFCGVLEEITSWLTILIEFCNLYLERVLIRARERQARTTVQSLEQSVDMYKGSRKIVDYKSGVLGEIVTIFSVFTREVLSKEGNVALLWDKLGLNRVQFAQPTEYVESLLGAKIGFAIKAIEVDGLETVGEVELARPVGRYTLEHRLSTVGVGIKILVDLMEGREGKLEWNSRIPLSFRIKLNVPSVVLQTLLAFDQDALWQFSLPPPGSNAFWNSVSCDLSAIRNVSLPKTILSRGVRIDPPVVASRLQDDFPLLVQGWLESVLRVTEEFVHGFKCSSVSAASFLFGEVLQELTAVAECGNQSTSEDTHPRADGKPNWIDWRKSRVAAYLRRLVPRFLREDDLNVNRLLFWLFQYLSDGQSPAEEIVTFKGVVFDTGSLHANHMFPSLGPNAALQVQVLNISVRGIGDGLFRAVDILAPSGPFELSHLFGLSPATISLNFTLAINATDVTRAGGVVLNVLSVSIDSNADPASFLEVLMSTRVQVDPKAILGVKLNELFNGCWASAFGEISLLNVTANYTGTRSFARIRVKCVDCASNSLKANMIKLSTSSGSNALLEKLEEKSFEILEFLSGRVNAFGGFSLNHLLASVLALAQESCNGTIIPSNDSAGNWHKPSWLRMRLFMLIGALSCCFMFLFAAHRSVRRSTRQRQEQDERLVPLLEGCQRQDLVDLSTGLETFRTELATAKQLPAELASRISLEDRQYLLNLDVALLRHDSIPGCARLTLCVFIVADFLLLVCSSMFVMGEVRIVAQVFGESMEIVPMLTLSLDNCIDMMLEGQAWIFAAFIGICSGMFPWLRVGMLLYAWTTPPNVLSPHSRQRLLQALSILGKWQFAEMYLFVILQVSMGVFMTNPSTLTFLEDRAFVIAIECVPQFGLLVFVVASVGATILNEAILYFHFEVGRADNVLLGIEESVQEVRETRGRSSACSAISWLFFLLVAMFVDVYAFEFMGMAGMGIQMMSEDGQKRKAQSAFSLLVGLANSDVSNQAAPVQLPVLVCVYALFVVVAPVASRIEDVVRVVRKQYRRPGKRRLLVDLSGIEVLCFTALVVVVQLGKFFAPFTSQLQFCPQFIGTVLKWGGAAADESVCFGTHVELLPTFSILCVYALACCTESLIRLHHTWSSTRDSIV